MRSATGTRGPSPIALSHQTAAVHLRTLPRHQGPVHLSSQAAVVRRLPTITVHRRILRPTDIVLEALFLPIAARARLPRPQTQQWLNGFRVDFYFPSLGLVVETDSLRHHRTPAEQAADRRRDQAHTAAGFTTLRFTHHQVKYEPGYVEATLARVADRLSAILGA